ncbi:hypothetical protein TorRG33x02_128370 [Trema orientale]|uniref:Pyridoxal phosphate homeostasis protein n=1 Tax=Trema orientale TaxID=63057 RepID=A0A2P5F0F5_TREOI|nr:hypothetical protein TorRG33x02_128370 [Trema orientale]
MTSYNSCLIVFVIYLRSISAQHSSLITIGDEIHAWKASKSISINMEDMETKLLAYSSVNDHHDQTKEDTEVTTNLRSWRGPSNRHHRPLRTPKKEEERCRKSWEIYHHLLGYVLIALIIADIFEGINHQHQATKWKWTYVGILVVLALTALSLEIFRWWPSLLSEPLVALRIARSLSLGTQKRTVFPIPSAVLPNSLEEQRKREKEEEESQSESDPDMATSAAMDGVAAGALRSVLHRVQQAADRSGRGSHPIRVVAVSKTKPVSLLRQVYDAGHRCFGENYVQEIVEKAPQLPEDIEWHFIGNLQSNKVKSLLTGVPNLAMVESVDDEKIANQLDRFVASIGRKPLKVLVQVNTSGEVSKSGVEPSGCVELAKHVSLRCPNLEFSGLMTIGMLDYTSTPENFKTLANCRSEVCKALGITEEQCELSMGMSGDFELAIEMGSTNVRIGSTIFGAREYPKKQS